MKLRKLLLQSFFISFQLLFFSIQSFSISNATDPALPVTQDTVQKQKYVARQQPVYTTSRLVTPKPFIDGKLDDECWKKGTWADDYHVYVPNEGAKPTYPTYYNIQYDDKNLYVAFRAIDREPEKIVRIAGTRDGFLGDMVGVTFDSYRDYRTGFEFDLSAWGQKTDLVLFNPANWDFNWNAVWRGKVGMEDSAWVAEFEIPFSQLRYSNKDEQVWGMHMWRWISRISEESDFEWQSKIGPGMLYSFGELRGIKGLKKSRRLELLPFVLGDLKTMQKEPGNPFSENGKTPGGNIGLDAKIGVSSNFTVDLTINPDFGQVESDPSVMNLTAFETFYEEKRPFFLEGLTIFENKFDDQSLFYSRRIGHAPSITIYGNDTTFVKQPDKTTILSAIKFSGTTSKGLSIGLIQSITANESAQISDKYGNKSNRQVEPLTNYTVARIQKGYNAGNTVVGGMITSTNRSINTPDLEFLSRNAYSGGLDILHHWKDKEFYLDARLIGSYVDGSKEAITRLQESSARYYQRPGADYLGYDTARTHLNGYGGKFMIGKGAKGFWKYSTGATWLSPGVELNDLGYMQSSDFINQENNISYTINQPVSIFHTYYISLLQINTWNFNGTYLRSGADLLFSSEFKNNWSYNTDLVVHARYTDTRILRGGPDMFMPFIISNSGSFRTDGNKKLIFSFSYIIKGSGQNSSDGYELIPGLSIRPINALKISLTTDYAVNRDNLQYVATKNYNNSKRYILGTIDQKTLGLTFRVDLNLTPEFSVQYYGSPFISRGAYSQFKHVINPEAKNYTDRFTVYNAWLSGNSYLLDENNDMVPDYSINNPDFTFYQYRSNMVLKWEYRLGSYIYLVWSSDRTGFSPSGSTSMKDSFSRLWKTFPNNIFLIKLNYWFSL